MDQTTSQHQKFYGQSEWAIQNQVFIALIVFAYMFWHKLKQIVREKPYKLAVI